MFFYTFHTNDYLYICHKYLDNSVLYAVKHYGFDNNNIEIKIHYHIISTKDLCLKYDSIYTYKNHIDLVDLPRIKNYCENGHCNYEIVYVSELFLAFVTSVKKINYNLDDLIKEIVYNSENNITRSHTHYLKKYGKVYLLHFKKLREMFDYSSAFQDWTDISSNPQRS